MPLPRERNSIPWVADRSPVLPGSEALIARPCLCTRTPATLGQLGPVPSRSQQGAPQRKASPDTSDSIAPTSWRCLALLSKLGGRIDPGTKACHLQCVLDPGEGERLCAVH